MHFQLKVIPKLMRFLFGVHVELGSIFQTMKSDHVKVVYINGCLCVVSQVRVCEQQPSVWELWDYS